MTYQPRTIAKSDEIERLLHYMPTVARLAENDWAANFARSILCQCNRRGWRPSPKQLSVMRSLVSDLFAHGGDEGGDFDLIES
ncbi:hypothetical protein [Microbulbifer sp. S227A]|uniref:hypothetical protein n=1 Tax=Microbulbifer sp. S227A TaxID=3415131 RepID=UPI003C7B9C90